MTSGDLNPLNVLLRTSCPPNSVTFGPSDACVGPVHRRHNECAPDRETSYSPSAATMTFMRETYFCDCEYNKYDTYTINQYFWGECADE